MARHIFRSILLLGLAGVVACSSPTDPGDSGDGPANVEGYPEVPRPQGVDDFDVPDQSDTYRMIRPIAGKDVDFAPTWTAGTFTWDVDIQTLYESFVGVWVQDSDPPGSYFDGTRHSSSLVFEGGVVDLRNPTPFKAEILYEPLYTYEEMPRRLMLMEAGEVVAEPYNPKVTWTSCHFQFYPIDGTADVRFDPPIFTGWVSLPVEAGALQRNKERLYYVAAKRAPELTNPVYMMRERFWRRVSLDGETKSVRVDPGNTKTVTFSRTTGMSYATAYEFAETLETQTGIEAYGVGTTVKSATTETFSVSREVSEQETLEVSHEITGIDGKTVIFSVWESVERYTFVDESGQPYTDPSYDFDDLGEAVLVGDHEILQSAIFEYEAQ